ncbi:class I SAM-dependent methyltransferase [Streptomyces sp. S1D4-23]|nr:class I SAM-dependent methyltransferase [Streptomyces sp. RLB3-6]QDO05290.1 class I SAM-dependent methyltransferase [Streptomyces sp. S1D4-23]
MCQADRNPLAPGSVDILTYAQAWHWTDPRKSVPEAVRVLRPGGALALWRNDSDSTTPWIAGRDAHPRRLFGAGTEEPDPMARVRGLPARPSPAGFEGVSSPGADRGASGHPLFLLSAAGRSCRAHPQVSGEPAGRPAAAGRGP